MNIESSPVTRQLSRRTILWASLCLSMGACGGNDAKHGLRTASDSGGAAGAAATGATGGSAGNSSSSITGGEQSSGGAAASGGATSVGGVTSTGASAGGAHTGGASALTGGQSSSGGSAATGGFSSVTGGTGTTAVATGGAATGGFTAVTGGAGTTAVATGGAATGGFSSVTGGTGAVGSVATGGVTTGGRSTGGAATGGAATGGAAAGGAATGGSSSTSSCTGISTELLSSPGFDGSNSVWSVQTTSTDPVFVLSADSTTPQAGTHFAWLGGFNDANEVLSQTAVVPSSAVAVTFSFYYWIVSSEVTQNPTDKLIVTITDGASTVLSNIATLSNANRYTSWQQYTLDLGSSLAGKTVAVRFQDTTDYNSLTSFYIDTVSLANCQ
jgi:hypothetical protein